MKSSKDREIQDLTLNLIETTFKNQSHDYLLVFNKIIFQSVIENSNCEVYLQLLFKELLVLLDKSCGTAINAVEIIMIINKYYKRTEFTPSLTIKEYLNKIMKILYNNPNISINIFLLN